MAFDALTVCGIAAFAHLHAFDLIGVVAVEASFRNVSLLRHLLVADVAGAKVRIVIGVVVTILAGGAVLIGGKMGFVVEENFACHGPVHLAEGLVRWLGGRRRITANPHKQQNSCKCVGQLKLFFWCHFRKVLCGWGINATAANPRKNHYHTGMTLSRIFFYLTAPLFSFIKPRT
jgi:hypothetical protein